MREVTVFTEASIVPWRGHEEDQVLSKVMKIPRLDGGRGYKSVMWDTSCSGVFVRTEHTERMNFPSWRKRLCVRTLGGII